MSKSLAVTAHVAEAVKRQRRQRGWTQQQLADAAGMKRVAIVHLETEHRESVTVDEVCALADALNVTPADLLPERYRGRRLSFEQAMWQVTTRYAEAIETQGAAPPSPRSLPSREELARILHVANTGRITPDDTDPTRYNDMAADVLERLGQVATDQFERWQRTLELLAE